MMKTIFLLLLVTVSLSFAQVSGRTTTFKLPYWNPGNKLSAGTPNDSSQSNDGLNNAFYRLEMILSRQLDGSGWYKSIYGDSTANLSIGLAGSQHNKRVLFRDSVYGYYNWQTEGNLLVQGNVNVGGYISTDSIVSEALNVSQFLYIGSAGTSGEIYMYGADDSYYAHLVRGLYTADRDFTLPNRSGIVALQTGNDSLQAPTIHAVLFASEKIAGTALNDTSALFTEWSTTSGSNVPIVRMKYLHKAGITYVTARYYAYSSAGDGWETQMSIGSLTQGDSDTNGSYGSTVQVNQLNVSGLTAGTLYDLQFKVSINTTGTSYFKELIITAESN
jgi:hypothetical protein